MESNKFNIAFGNYTADERSITTRKRNELIRKGQEVVSRYGYCTDYVPKIIDEWAYQKADLIALFKHSPLYNGNFQIVLDANIDRGIMEDVAYEVYAWMEQCVPFEKSHYVFSECELSNMVDDLERKKNYMEVLRRNGNRNVLLQGRNYEQICIDLAKYREAYLTWRNKYVRINGEVCLRNQVNDGCRRAFNYFRRRCCKKQFIEATDVSNLQEFLPDFKVCEGQKISKVVQKIGKLCGLDKITGENGWNKQYARLGDAINPIHMNRHVIVSINPIDYWLMSNGTNWSSCHTINKQNSSTGYSGCYSGGTESYMLDATSIIFYTVEELTDHPELAPKEFRCMFHLGEDKLIQGRVYPQGKDGATEVYAQIRETVQKVISEAFGVPNYWRNVKGTSELYDLIWSEGVNYEDYFNFNDCNVSYLKTENPEDENHKKITIGKNPICPGCGCRHDWAEAIECEDCYNGCTECYDCGCSMSEDEGYFINGEWYCDNCTMYCWYHDEREHASEDDGYYIEDYGWVCEDALQNSGEFCYCDYCGEWKRISDMLHSTREDVFFCDTYCAERNGFIYLDSIDDWVSESETSTCEECGEIFLTEDLENGLCEHCRERHSEDEEVA